MLLSLVMPAHNEEGILSTTVEKIMVALDQERIATELVIVNDNSKDGTQAVAEKLRERWPAIKIVTRTPPGGFGRAIRSGIEAVTGDAVVIVMADDSDDPRDIVAYYRKIEEGYDCVFGSRFRKGSVVKDYPWVKRVMNRIVNKMIQLLFWTRFNDLTNAFKAYRTDVIRQCGPYTASHFNITIEMSLSALIRKYHIAEIPIRWYGRTWGSSNLRITEMGRRYLSVLLKLFFDRILVSDDLMSERAASRAQRERADKALRDRLDEVESVLGIGARPAGTESPDPTVASAGQSRRQGEVV